MARRENGWWEADLHLPPGTRYRFAVVAHPIGSLTQTELQARAAAALPQVIAILTSEG